MEEERRRLVASALGYLTKVAQQYAIRTGKDRDELFQIGALGLCQAAQAYRPEVGPFDRFAMTRAIGAILDALRKEGRLVAVSPEAFELLGASGDGGEEPATPEVRLGASMLDCYGRTLAGSPSLAAPVVRELRLAGLEALRSRLSDRDRELLAMRFEEGLSGREIGERLGVSPSQANRRLLAVEARLRELVLEAGLLPREPGAVVPLRRG